MLLRLSAKRWVYRLKMSKKRGSPDKIKLFLGWFKDSIKFYWIPLSIVIILVIGLVAFGIYDFNPSQDKLDMELIENCSVSMCERFGYDFKEHQPARIEGPRVICSEFTEDRMFWVDVTIYYNDTFNTVNCS